MEDFATYEYVVNPSKQPKYKWRRILFLIGYIVYVIALMIAGIIARILAPMLALVPLSTWILVWLTWRYASVEYEYSMTSGTMTLTKIYGNRTRKCVAEIKIKDMTMIAPFEDTYIREATAYAPEETIDFTSDLQSPDVYIVLFETKSARRGILYFEATGKALKILRFYNPATVVKAVRY